jgi:hypothetical protein
MGRPECQPSRIDEDRASVDHALAGMDAMYSVATPYERGPEAETRQSILAAASASIRLDLPRFTRIFFPAINASWGCPSYPVQSACSNFTDQMATGRANRRTRTKVPRLCSRPIGVLASASPVRKNPDYRCVGLYRQPGMPSLLLARLVCNCAQFRQQGFASAAIRQICVLVRGTGSTELWVQSLGFTPVPKTTARIFFISPGFEVLGPASDYGKSTIRSKLSGPESSTSLVSQLWRYC